MNRNYVIGIVVLAVIIIIGWVVSGSGSKPVSTVDTTVSTDQLNTGTTTSTGSDSVLPSATLTEVTFTDNGFTPATVTIKKGETVRFTNQSSELMWVASNPHPTHTDYSEFDERTSVGAGGSYEFTFTKIGNWKYHNHKDPSGKGEIIVE